ncbi:MAG TPA: MlaD family protein [Baekduia sp.]|nr:MlaD family protein [Baekduia sp.]
MKPRLIAIAVALVAALVVVVLGTGAKGDNGSYKVRAIFNNAFTVIPGEDVKIAGVKVGKIDALDVTPDNKAAVVLDITEPGFQDFRKDATCTIRPQSLIGERFVECTPTQPRPDGAPLPPELPVIQHGDGEGQHLLPASQTIKPVDLDLVTNIMRLPYRQRFSIIINELGTGLAANGGELRQAIRAADPALLQTDRVLKILADQNQTLRRLAENGDKVLAPLARDRQRVAHFIETANTTAQASAERRADIEANFERFPKFLQELRPTMQQLGAMADQMNPVLASLGAAAPDVNRLFTQMGPLAEAATPALKTLGDAADVGDQALLKSKPTIQDLGTFASKAKPTTKNLGALLSSLRDTGGMDWLMNYLYYQTAAVNGYDSLGHYLRAVLVIGTCTDPKATPGQGCNGSWAVNQPYNPKAGKASVASTPSVTKATASPRKAAHATHKLALPTVLPGQTARTGSGAANDRATTDSPASTSAPAGTASVVRPPSTDAGTDAADAKLLDYLLGD